MTPIRFGPFEVDARSGELRRDGQKIRLQEQPFQVLVQLLERPGEVVTREELTERLWPGETYVDFERGLNKAINRLREALGDSAEIPRYVETLPRRGYRFIAPVSVNETTVEAKVKQAPVPAKSSRPRVVVALSLGAILLASAGLPWRSTTNSTRVPRVLRFKQLTTDGQAKDGPLATDGSRIFFNEVLPGPRSVVMQVPVHGGESVPVAIPLNQAKVADVSADGTQLLLTNGVEAGCSLWIQPVAGGSPRRVGTDLAHDAAFGPNAATVIYGSKHDVYSIRSDGSDSRKLLPAGHVSFAFQYSPDERVFRFSTFDVQKDDMSIFESKSDGSKIQMMFHGCWGRWTADGRYFVFQNRRDGRLDFWTLSERRAFAWAGGRAEPIQLTAGPLDYQYPLPSRDGKAIFALGTTHRAELIRYEKRIGQFVPFLAGISAEGLSFSQDGQWVAYVSYPEGNLCRSKIDGSEKIQLTFPPLRAFFPRWSPDGRQIAFSGDLPTAPRNIYVISSEGGTARRVHASEQSQSDANWSPDGSQLIFGTLFVQGAPISLFDVRSNRVSTVTGSNGLDDPQWSPDGKSIAALTTGGRGKLMLFDVGRQEWTEAAGITVGYPTWSHDGKYIYFQYSRDQGHQAVGESIGRLRLADHKIENVIDVKNVGRVTTGTFVNWFGLAPDDSPLFARDISTQEIYALEIEWP